MAWVSDLQSCIEVGDPTTITVHRKLTNTIDLRGDHRLR
jgi:hypothetical protein